MSYSFDASSIIHLWDNYPMAHDHFKTLWQSFSTRFENKTFTISDVALEEVKHKIPNFEMKFKKLEPDAKSLDDLREALSMKRKLGIQEENYDKDGVCENDLLIIAIAKRNNHILISEEAIHKNLPKQKKRYKIPAVCKEIAKITCHNIQYLLHQKIL